MSRVVLHPRFGLSVRKRDGDEGCSGVVDADRLARFGALEQRCALDAGVGEVPAVAVGLVAAADALAAFVGEDEVVVGHGNAHARTQDAEDAEREHDAAHGRKCKVI